MDEILRRQALPEFVHALNADLFIHTLLCEAGDDENNRDFRNYLV
jgi:hypothetical protein